MFKLRNEFVVEVTNIIINLFRAFCIGSRESDMEIHEGTLFDLQQIFEIISNSDLTCFETGNYYCFRENMLRILYYGYGNLLH
jgi:hypothetical protein